MQQNEIFPCFVDSSGNVVVKYIYDAWGNHAVVNASGEDIGDATHIGNRNPIRYRGYYYDTETGLYYLKTRYYDPEVGRFITIDDISYLDPDTINGLNLYAYCGNNPVMRVDPNGNKWWEFWKWDWKKIGMITDVGTDISKLALPSTNSGLKITLQATKNFRVYTGVIAPNFGSMGGGIQYVMRYSIKTLLKKGWLIIV